MLPPLPLRAQGEGDVPTMQAGRSARCSRSTPRQGADPRRTEAAARRRRQPCSCRRRSGRWRRKYRCAYRSGRSALHVPSHMDGAVHALLGAHTAGPPSIGGGTTRPPMPPAVMPPTPPPVMPPEPVMPPVLMITTPPPVPPVLPPVPDESTARAVVDRGAATAAVGCEGSRKRRTPERRNCFHSSHVPSRNCHWTVPTVLGLRVGVLVLTHTYNRQRNLSRPQECACAS